MFKSLSRRQLVLTEQIDECKQLKIEKSIHLNLIQTKCLVSEIEKY